ncbi:MAG: class I SAM-dependent methyltransferase [Candidatus Izemoplasma sp.]
MVLSKRLNTCLQYTRGFSLLADIGTDHAYLPIEAVNKGFVDKVLAIDNKEGPYVVALSNVLKANLSPKIKVILGDGLNKITDEVDVVVISGMGGKLISDIIIKDNLLNVKRLILQPNSDSFYIREVLKDIGFYIVDELYLSENTKYYEVLVLERGVKDYSKLEIKFGPYNLINKPYLFVKNITDQLDYLKKVLPNIINEDKITDIKQKIISFEEVLVWMDK